jgi:hypothetical protein
MDLLYNMLMAANATSWVVVIYGIKADWTVGCLKSWQFSIILLFVPIVLSAISVLLTLPRDKDDLRTCSDLKEANISFLPVYLGYFFVGLGIGKLQHLFFVYLIILVFTCVAQTQYYNPIYLLFGFRYYEATTAQGTNVFLIVRGNLRKATDAKFENLRRINDTTYIAWREK